MSSGGAKADTATMNTLLVMLITLLVNAKAQAANSKRPLKLSVATAFCRYSSKAKQASAGLANRLDSIQTSLKAAEKAALQHEFAAAALPQYSAAAATLAIFARAASDRSLNDLQQWAQHQTKTVGQAMYVSGRIDGLMEVLEGHMSTTKTNNKGCIANDGDATGIDKFVANTCGPQDTTTLTAEPIDLQGALTQDIPEETDPETLGGADHCLINDNPHSKYTAVTTPINLLDGTLKIPASGGFQTTTNVRHATLQSKLFKELKDKGAQLAQPLTATAQQIPTDYSALKNLLKDSSSREALKPAVAQYQNKAAGDTSITDDTIKAIFGLTKDNSEDGYLAAIKNLERPVPTTAGKSAPTNLFAMTCTQLEAALTVEISGIYEKSVELNKEIETLRQNQGKQASEQACNNIKIEADCNATAACSFNKTETDSNKKCQYDAQKATTNEVSVTQHQTGGTLTVNCSGHNNRPDSSEKKIL
uniref:Variant surface glycoprotein (VSG), putative n=1 Tax=Trypanosoma brucei brucei (strain 927/4 GUTat10.1) TaxID=185431 RepID=Q4FKK0_TRYB2|nr:variant surface glycoprotein (VSG), putative [Trypanosoma brucei brucei TREU927]